MVKGGRQFAPTHRGGKWFAHPDSVGSTETCTRPGITLTPVKSTVPQIERYPKWKSQQKSREFPYSEHDNKCALRDSILTFIQAGLKRKSPEESVHRSQFSLYHEDVSKSSPRPDLSVSQSDYKEKHVSDPTGNRRFCHNHQLKSEQAAQARDQDCFMWFARAGSP